MNIFHAFLLGLLQGLTEFIPVSSTAHLLIAQKLLGIAPSNAMFAFLVLVQIGTILSLIVYFWKDLLKLVKAFFASLRDLRGLREAPRRGKDHGGLSLEARLAWYILIATIPALLAGVLFKHFVEALFKTPLLEAAIRLLAAAVLLALAEWLGKRTRRLESMSWLDALIVGIFQVLAVFPGASRSGTTISGSMLRGFDRPSAARFAFLMSVPVMLAAGAYESLDVFKLHNLGTFLPSLAVGFVVAAIVGWFAVRWLLGYLNKHSLYIFAAYCSVVGVICLFFI